MVPSSRATIYRATSPGRFFTNFESVLWISFGFCVLVGTTASFVFKTSFGVALLAAAMGFFVIPVGIRLFVWPKIERQLDASAQRLNDRDVYVAYTHGGLLLSPSAVVLTGSELREDGSLSSSFVMVEPFERGRPEHARALEEAIREDIDDLAETLHDGEELVERLTVLGVPDPTAVAKATSTYCGSNDE